MTADDTREQLIRMTDERGEFVRDVDGFVYYAPEGWGHLSAWVLRAIADELDRRNAPWQEIIDNDPTIGEGVPAGEG